MPKSPAIPPLTPEETALARQAEHSEHIPLATVLRYIHWSKARAGLLDAIAEQGQQLALVSKEGESHD